MALSPTLAQIKIKELLLLEIQSNSLANYTNRNPCPPSYTNYTLSPQDKLLERLKAHEILSFSSDANRVLQAFSFLLLRTIYGSTLNQPLLNTLKTNLYKDTLDLTSISNFQLPRLSSNEMKKFVAEFVIELYFTDFEVVFFKKIAKYSVIIDILTLFLRCILVGLGLAEAGNYLQDLPTDTVVELLSDYFDMNYRKTKGAYLFLENSLFLYRINSEEVVVGEYGDSHPKKKEVINPELKGTQNRTNQETRSSSPNKRFSLLYEMRESEFVGSNAPTPQFSTGTDHEEEAGRSLDQIGFHPQGLASPFSKIKTGQEPPSSEHFSHRQVTTPSSNSLDENTQLHYSRSTGLSPIAPLSSSLKNSSKHPFHDLVCQNEHLFACDQAAKGSLPQCFCKDFARGSLKMESKLYQITIEPKGPIQKPKNVFKGKYKFRKFSEIQAKKEEQQEQSMSHRNLAQDGTENKTDRSFTSINTATTPTTPPIATNTPQAIAPNTTPVIGPTTITPAIIGTTTLRSDKANKLVGGPVERPATTYVSECGSPRFVFFREKIRFNYMSKK